MEYFGSNIVEGVAESWVESEMSWVELGGAGWSWVEMGGLVIPKNKCERYLPKSQIKILERVRGMHL